MSSASTSRRRTQGAGVSSKANQAGGREPSGMSSFSEKDVKGTTHRLSTPSQRRQCGDATLRMFVTPGSRLRPFTSSKGDGMPQRAITSSRPSPPFRTIGARVIWKDARQGRHVADVAVHGAREVADRLRALGDAVEIAHFNVRLPGLGGSLGRSRRIEDETDAAIAATRAHHPLSQSRQRHVSPARPNQRLEVQLGLIAALCSGAGVVDNTVDAARMDAPAGREGIAEGFD